MMYNRKIKMPNGDYYLVIEIIRAHWQYKKKIFNPSNFMYDDSIESLNHRKRLFNFVEGIQDWANHHNWKGESEYIVTRYLENEWLKEE